MYNAKKYALAAKEFEKFESAGTADISTHKYLAYSYYYQRLYTKALKEFDWLANNDSKSLTDKRAAEATALTLRSLRSGVCPATCLKANDPRWQRLPDKGDELWIKFPNNHNGWQAWSRHHIGELVVYEHGDPVNKGTCPTCNGTGKVTPLKDGAPLPR